MMTFTLPDGYVIACRSEKTRYGFRHLAELTHNGYTVAKDKACYYNRTWESFDFQTVAHGVIRKYFGEDMAVGYNQIVDKQGHGEVERTFGMVGAITKLGEIFCDSTEDKNKWKRRMLEAGLSGLDFPDDFDSLSEEEKERRLDKAIKLTTAPATSESAGGRDA